MDASNPRAHRRPRLAALPRRHDVRRLGQQDHQESNRIIDAALEAGINFIDTADVYSRGESEEIVGKAIKGKRDDIVLATKFHGTMGDDPNEAGNSRRWIFREVEASLKRLQTDWIDLYQVHRWDPWTDHEETLGALTDLVAAGQGPLHRQLDLPGGADRQGAVHRARSAATSASSPSSRPTACSSAISRTTCCRRRSSTAWA